MKTLTFIQREKTEIFPPKTEIPKNWLLGVLKPAEYEFGNEQFLGCRIEGLQVYFREHFYFAR